MHKTALKYVLIANLAMVCSARASAEIATVYCSPFGIETYKAITPERVRAAAWEKWTIDSAQEIADLRAFLKQGAIAKFSEGRVRAAVDIGAVSYYIDAEGVVRTDGEPDRKVDRIMFARCDAPLIEHRKRLETQF